MSQTIDNRIVEMQFENKQFESGVQESLSTLDKLKNALKFDDASRSLQDFSKNATKNLDLSGIEAGVQKLSDRFSASGIAGMEVIRSLTDFAIDAGKKIGSALSAPFEQIKSGGWARAMNIEDAKFQLKGLGIAWESVEKSINDAVQDTAYGLDAAAKACSQLSASGVQAGEDMTRALRGISGVAAMGNTEYENIAQIFTKAAGNGRVMADELNRISQYGLNARASVVSFFNDVNNGVDKVRENNIPEEVQKHVKSITGGTQMIEADLSDMVKKGKLDFETFAYAMDYAFGEHAKAANETFMGSLRNIKAALSKIGAEFATPIIKGAVPVFNEIRIFLNDFRKQLEPITNAFKNIVNIISENLTKKLKQFSNAFLNLGGLEHLGNALHNVFQSLVKIIAAFADAFNSVFGDRGSTTDRVLNVTSAIEKFSEKLVISDNAALGLRNVLVVLFNILKAIGSVISGLLPIIGKVLSIAGKVVSVIFGIIGYLVSLVSHLNIVQKVMTGIQESGGLFAYAVEKIKEAFSNLKTILGDTSTVTGQVFAKLKDAALTVAAVVAGALYLAFLKVKEVVSYFDTKDPLGSLVKGAQNLITTLKELPFVNTIISGIEKTIGLVVTAFTKLIALVKEFITNLQSGMSVIQAVGVSLNKVFSGVVSIVGSLIEKFTSLFSMFKKDRVIEENIEIPIANAGESLVGFEKQLTKTKDGVVETSSAFTKGKNAIISFGSAILDKIRSINAGTVMLFSLGAAVILLTANLSKLVKSITGVTKKATELLDVFINITKRKTTFLEAMLGISIGLVALAGSLVAISKIDKNEIVKVTVCLGGLIAVIGIFSAITKNSKMNGFAISMASFSAGILILVAALYALDELNMDGIWTKVGVLGAIVGILFTVSVLLGKFVPSLTAGSLALVAFAGSVYILTKALETISNANLENIKNSWVELSAIIIAFGVFAATASSVGVAAALGLIGFMLTLKVMLNHTETIKKYFGSFEGAFKSITDILKSGVNYLYNGFKKVAKDIEESETLAKVLQNSIGAIIVAVVGTILALGKAGKGLKKAATGFVLVAAAIAGLMYVTVKISDLVKNADQAALNKSIGILEDLMKFLTALSAISAVVGIVGMVTKSKDTFNMLKDLRKLLTSMGILLVAIGLFAAMVGSLGPDEFERVKWLLLQTEITIGLIAIVSAAIVAASSKAGKSQIAFTTFVGIVMMIGSLVAAIAVLMYTFSQVNWEQDQKMLAAVAISFVGIVASILFILHAIASIEKNASEKGSWKVIPILLSFAAMIAAFGYVVYKILQECPTTDDLTRAGVIAGGLIVCMAALSGLALALSKFANKISDTGKKQIAFAISIAAIIAMAGSIKLLATSIGDLADDAEWADVGRMGAISAILIASLTAITALVYAIERFTNSTKTKITKENSKSLLITVSMIAGFVGGFILLAKEFKKMQNVNAGQMAAQSAVITSTLYALSALVLGIQKFMKDADAVKIAKVEATIAVMEILFSGLALMFSLIKDIDATGMVEQSAVITGTLTAISALVFGISKLMNEADVGQIAKVEGTVAVMEVLFGALSGIFYLIKDLDAALMAKQALTLAGTLTALSALVLGIDKLLSNAKVLKIVEVEATIAVMEALFAGLALIFKYIVSDIPNTEDLDHKIIALIGTLLSLEALCAVAGAIGLLKEKIFIGEAALAAMVGIFWWLSYIFQAVSDLNIEGLQSKADTLISALWSLIGIATVLGLLGAVMVATEGLGALAEAAGLASMALMVAIFEWLTDVFNTISAMNLEGFEAKKDILISAMWSLVGILSVLGVASPLALLALVGMPSLLLCINGLRDIAAALNSVLLAAGDVNEVQAVADAMTGVMWSIVGVLTVLGVASPLAAVALLAIPSLLLCLGGLTDIAGALNMLKDNDMTQLKGAADALTDVMWSMVGVLTVLGVASPLASLAILVVPSLLSVADGMVTLAKSLKTIQSMNIEQAKSAVDTLVDILWSFAGIGAASSVIGDLGPGLVSLAEGITATSQACVTATSSINTFESAIISLNDALAKSTAIVETTAEGLANAFRNTFEKILDAKALGKQVASGLAEGINSGNGDVKNAAINLANTVIDEAKRILDIHSPSGVFEEIGGYVISGLGIGIENNSSEATVPIQDVVTKMKDTIGNVDWTQIGNSMTTMLSNGAINGSSGFFSLINQMNNAIFQVNSNIKTMTSSWAQGRGTLADYEYQLKTQISSTTKELERQNTAYERLSANGTRSGENAKKAAENTRKELENLNGKLNDLYGNTKKADEVSSKFANTLGDVGKGGGKAAAGAKEAKDAISDFYDSIESAINLFDKFEEEEAMSSEELLSNMESQILGITNWSNNLSALATKGIDQGLLQKLADMGPSGQKYVAAFVNMTGDELARANQLYQQSLLLPANVTAQVFTSFEAAGINATTGFIGGLDHDAVRSQGISFAKSFISSFEQTLGIASPSKVTQKDGRYATEGFTEGLTLPSAMNGLMNTIKSMGTETITWFELYFDSKKFQKIGEQITAGLVEGIRSGESAVISAAADVANAAIKEANRVLDIHSPSRAFQKIGKFIDEGLAKGISDNTNQVTDEIGKTSTDMINSMRNAINRANESLIDDVDDPVIRPVLDLSNIEEGSKSINDVFSRNQVLSASRSFSNLQNQQWDGQSALINAASDNSDVVSAVNSLKTDIDGLKEAMTNIRMVLDTGTMVGAMTPMIDQQLGMRQVYAGRGM